MSASPNEGAACRAVLGIDAAWTVRQPSGVALVVGGPGAWQLRAAAASYGHYAAICAGEAGQMARALGAVPDAAALLAGSLTLCGRAVDLVGIDMPLSLDPITGRRPSDNAVSRAYGARKCGTHTPSAARPGALSDALRDRFSALGYPLQTALPVVSGVIEVYPHPALVELVGAPQRLRYKIAKAAAYWPDASRTERRCRVMQEWRRIVAALDAEIAGVAASLRPPAIDSPVAILKAYEDMLDAVVCAWVSTCVLEGRAVAHGDARSAIWVPRARLTAHREPR